MKENEAHSPLPWKVRIVRPGWNGVDDADGNDIIEVNSNDGSDEPKPYPDTANAAFIVQAVNSYTALLEAAREAITLLDDHVDNALDATIVLRAAIALTEKDQPS